MSDLARCPFCGGPAAISPGNYKGRPTCDHCGATARYEDAWNRRAPDPRIERAREALTRTARKLNSVAVVERAMNGGGLTTDMEEIVAGVSKALAALDKEVTDA